MNIEKNIFEIVDQSLKNEEIYTKLFDNVSDDLFEFLKEFIK